MPTEQIYFTIATAGHVDHGKTSVLRALTGIDPDRLKEEKLRQMTTDLGFAHLRLADSTGKSEFIIGFIDVPGHGKFLKNMLAGVGGIDMALLVVAADEGPMPQTIKHVKILSLLGVKKAFLVLSKIDIASETQQQEAEAASEKLLQRYGVTLVDTVKTASPSKGGIKELSEHLRTVLESHVRREATGKLPLFLPIDRVFSKSGYGIVVTGTLVRGEVTLGDSVFVEPGNLRARVRGLETFGQSLQKAKAGQRLALNLTFKEHVSLTRGQTILGERVEPVSLLLVELAPPLDEEDKTLEKVLPQQQIRLYHGTAECFGQVRWVDTISGEAVSVETKEEPELHKAGRDLTGGGAAGPRSGMAGTVERSGASGGAGIGVVSEGVQRMYTAVSTTDEERPKIVVAQIALVDPIVAEPGERFVLRYGDTGIAGGAILSTVRPRWQTRQYTLEFARRLASSDFAGALTYYVERSPQKLLKQELITGFVPRALKGELVDRMCGSAALVHLGGYLSTPAAKEQLVEKLLKELTARQSGGGGVERFPSMESLRAKVMPGVDRTAFQELIRELTEAGRVVRQADSLSLPEVARITAQPGKHAVLGEKILTILSEVLCLEIEEISKRTSTDKKIVIAAIQELAKQQQASVINYDFASSQSAINRAHQTLAKLWQQKKEITPADFRDALGTSRKYAMALLAHFDDNQITRRLTNSRVLLKGPRPPS